MAAGLILKDSKVSVSPETCPYSWPSSVEATLQLTQLFDRVVSRLLPDALWITVVAPIAWYTCGHYYANWVQASTGGPPAV